MKDGRSDNSIFRNLYTDPRFWLDPSAHFWNSVLYSQKSKDYFQKFVEEQSKEANRKFKN